jgi:signal transduction histidine kinase
MGRGIPVDELALPDLCEIAARACINERCALSYLHDIRGSMQALFSAVELLSRSAKSGTGNQERIDKAADLARRAIAHHEKTAQATLQALTLQPAVTAPFEIGPLVEDAAHFLRNEASTRQVTFSLSGAESLRVSTDRGKFYTVLIGLLLAAIDAVDPGSLIDISVAHRQEHAVISIDTAAGYRAADGPQDLLHHEGVRIKDLTRFYAQRFLAAHGGRLEVDEHPAPRGVLRIHYPVDA